MFNLKSPIVSFFALVLICLHVIPFHRQENVVVEAIKCYVCQSNIDPKCADPFDNLTLPITDCDAYPRPDLAPRNEMETTEERGLFSVFSQPAPVKPLRATMCRKIRQKVNGEWRTIRGCGYLDTMIDDKNPDHQSAGHYCQNRHGSYDVFMESCVCNNKDGCNSALSRVAISPYLMSIFTIVPSIFMINSIALHSQSFEKILRVKNSLF